VQAEDLGDLVHLLLVRLVQPDPGERVLPGQLQLGRLGAGVDVAVPAGQALAADIDAAIDDRVIGGQLIRLRLRLRMRRLIPLGPCQRTQCFGYVA